MPGLPAKLTDPWFEAHFIAECTDQGHRVCRLKGQPYTLAEAQGLFLWCPCGYGQLDEKGEERYPLDLLQNKGRPHGVIVVFSNPPCGILPPAHFGPASRDGQSHPRWTVSGTSLHDLTLQPSVAVGNQECWHGFITDGMVR